MHLLLDIDHFVVEFYESLNKVTLKQRVGIVVGFWSNTNNQVRTKYLTLVFLEHITAVDLLAAYKGAFSETTIIQVSVDGPNVNFKFLKIFKQKLVDGNPDITRLRKMCITYALVPSREGYRQQNGILYRISLCSTLIV